MNQKFIHLQNLIRTFDRVIVAFSGGVDSTFVTKVSRDVLGKEHVLAVTAQSESLSPAELEDAICLAREMDVRHEIIETREMENPNYKNNPMDRCYFCKTELYDHLVPLAGKFSYPVIFDGTNVDDLSDERPGLRAAREHGVRSPLVEAHLMKAEIRELSKGLGLRTWDKAEMACLSSRIPHGSVITEVKLRQVDELEQFIRSFGFKQVRARHLEHKVRIEVEPENVNQLMKDAVRIPITKKVLSMGFKEVLIAPEGYRR